MLKQIIFSATTVISLISASVLCYANVNGWLVFLTAAVFFGCCLYKLDTKANNDWVKL